MAEKTKLKWLRKEFGSSEELEYYLTQLKHQDKLKSDLISLLVRFQHLLFAGYEPDFLTITFNGQWDVAFGPASVEPVPDEKKIKSDKISSAKTKAAVKNVSKRSSEANLSPKRKLVSGSRINLKTLMDAKLISPGARLRYKNRPSVTAVITRDGNIKIGKNEYQSLSGAATSFVPAGRRDGWLCWLFQDRDGDWKPIDLLRDRWREMG